MSIFNVFKTSILPFNVLSISLNIYINKEKPESIISKDVTKNESLNSKQLISKTTLKKHEIGIISKIGTDVIAYLFIEKNKDRSAWNLIAPIVLEKYSGKIYQYDMNCFALEGCGGGLRNTKDIIHELKRLSQRNINVCIIPKVIDNELIHGFEYNDSDITLNHLINNSIDLINYRIGSLQWIYKQFEQINEEEVV